MKNKFSATLLLCSAFAFAQEIKITNESTNQLSQKETKSDWKHSIGVNFRSFDKIKLKQRSVNGGNFINGSVTDIGAGNYLYVVADPASQILVDPILNDTITYASASATPGDSSIDGGLAGVTLKSSKVFSENGIFSWSFDLSLTTAYVQNSNYANAILSYTEFDFGADWNSSIDGNGDTTPGPYPPGAPVDGKTEGVSGNYSPGPGAGSTAMTVKYDLNLGLYTFGLGVSGSAKLGPVNVFIGAGPTVSVVDYDIEYSASLGSFSEKESCDSTRLRGGLYGEIGLEVPLNEKWSIGASGRYDWISVDINTDLGKVELSGLSGNIFIGYKF